MNDKIWTLVLIALAIIATAIVTGVATEGRWEDEAIKRGVGERHPQTGEFQWTVEVKEAEHGDES